MIKLIFTTSTSAAFEWQNGEAYYRSEEYTVSLNGKEAYCGNTNVFSLFGLTPDTEYTVSSDNVSLTFTTGSETAAMSARDFGAVGDGVTDDTAALQTAINCLPVGARLYIPDGVYLTAPLCLKSHMTLELAEGATLLGTPDRGSYPVIPGTVADLNGDYLHLGVWEGFSVPMYQALLFAEHAEDITIVGRGTLDGNGEAGGWWQEAVRRGHIKLPRLFFCNRCDSIRLHGTRFTSSPNWNIHPYFSSNVEIIDIAVTAPKNSPNTDGIDPEACDRVDIIGCRISVGDDCIAIKSGKYELARLFGRPASRHTVRNCLMEFGHGALTLGSEIGGGLKELTVNRCVFDRTDRGLRIKTRRGRGERSDIDGVTFENIKMTGVLTPIVINSFYFCDSDGKSDYVQTREALPVDERTPHLGSFIFRNMTCEGCEAAACYCEGLPERPIDSITFENIEFSFSEDARASVPAMCYGVGEMHRAGMIFKSVDELILRNVRVIGTVGEELTVEKVGKIAREA